MEKTFQDIYPFTTESISGYITKMNIENKKVLTLGSSCDQALNSLLLGASDVTIFDINEKIKYFYELKKQLILSSSRNELVSKVLENKQFSYSEDIFSKSQLENMNLYLQNDDNYNKLKKILETKNINFITGNIFDIDKSLKEKYDRVILSNVLQYIPENTTSYDVYNKLSKHLNEKSIVQLYYLYGSMYPKGFSKVVNQFINEDIMLELNSCDENDSVILIKK